MRFGEVEEKLFTLEEALQLLPRIRSILLEVGVEWSRVRDLNPEIQKVRERDEDLSGWLEYVAEGIVETLERTRRRVQTLRVKSPPGRITLNPRQERILQILGTSPRMPGGTLCRAMKLSRARFSRIMRPLIVSGMVLKEGSTRAAVYRLS